MNRKLTKKQVRQAAKEVEKQELIKAKKEVPELIEKVQQEKKGSIQDITNHLNKKLKELIPGYKEKTVSAIRKWAPKKSDPNNNEIKNDPNESAPNKKEHAPKEVKSDPNKSAPNKKKPAPNNKEVKIVVKVLKELLGPSAQGINAEYETFTSAMEQVFPSGIIRIMPQDLKDFWKKQYSNTFKNTFKLYNWQNTFSLLKLEPAKLKQELENLDNSFPKYTRIYSQISILIPIAKEIEGDQGSYLFYAFDNTDKSLGLYLWNINGYYEYPLFIANSVTDLIDHHIITLETQDNLYFDREKYLNETFEKNMKGYILPLHNDSNDINTHLKILAAFYEKAFNRGSIKFEAAGDLITVYIESGDLKRFTYNIKDWDLFLFIEKLNDELNAIDKLNFCRPKYYGYYLINEKYLAYLRLDIATDLIQKGYINSRFKMLPRLAFYNSKVLNVFNVFRAFADNDKQENQKITPL